MGIRFDCPNGHRLNVKAFLAGKRAICPDCGIKLTVPVRSVGPSGVADSPAPPDTDKSIQIKAAQTRHTTNSRQRAAAHRRQQPLLAPARLAGSPSESASSLEMAGAANLADATPATESNPPAGRPSNDPSSTRSGRTGQVWYVRPPAGGQYGPATDETLSRWIGEGRIDRDTYIWREGWSDWQLAGKSQEQLPAPLPKLPNTQPPVAPGAATGELQGAMPESIGVTSGDVRRARRRANRRLWLTAVLLMILVIALAGILVWVIGRSTT